MGYDGVEPIVVDPAAFSEDRVEDAIRRAGLEVPCVCTGEIPGQTGLSFTSDDAAVRGQAIMRAKQVVDFAARWKACVNLGRFRGRVGVKRDRTTYEAYCTEAVLEVATYAARRQVCWVLEPVTGLIHNFITNTAEAIDYVRKIDHANFRLMVDVFHQNIEDPSIYGALIAAAGILKHVHISDSNKLAPGTGHLDLLEYVRVLRAVGYDEYLSAEVFQIPDQDTAAQTTIEHLRQILRRL